MQEMNKAIPEESSTEYHSSQAHLIRFVPSRLKASFSSERWWLILQVASGLSTGVRLVQQIRRSGGWCSTQSNRDSLGGKWAPVTEAGEDGKLLLRCQ